jgi:hypothetical protein
VVSRYREASTLGNLLIFMGICAEFSKNHHMRIKLLTLLMVTGLATASPAALAATSPRAAPSLTRLTQVSSDPFVNSGSDHATEVEPDTYAEGSTIVGAFQTGRFPDGGASDIGWATSLDAGRRWVHGSLPDTVYSRGPYARMSDPVVAYDKKYRTVLTLAFLIDLVPGVIRPCR